MHKRTILTFSAALLWLASCASTSKEVTATLPPGANTTCPIEGHAVSPTSYYEHNGKRIYICCDDCLAGVAADPDAALSKAYPPK